MGCAPDSEISRVLAIPGKNHQFVSGEDSWRRLLRALVRSRLSRQWPWIGSGTLVAVFVNGANAEKIIIFRHAFHGEGEDVTDPLGVRPGGFGRVAPDDLITRQV